MSWLFSRALVEAYSAATSSGGEPSAPSNTTHTLLAYLSPDRMTAFSRLSRFGMTFAPLTDGLGEAVLMWCREGSRVRTSAAQGRAQASPESAAAYGPRWRELSARYDRDSCSWKTHRTLFPEVLPWSSVALPRWGMMRDGVCWEQMTPERPTAASESGLWQSPTAMDATPITGGELYQTASGTVRARYGNTSSNRGLAARVMWPTPVAAEGRNRHMPDGKRGIGLEYAAGKTFPTPRAEDSQCAGGHRGKDDTLYGAICRPKQFPTPCASEARQGFQDRTRGMRGSQESLSTVIQGAPAARAGGSLSPTWTEWLMNWVPGWTSLEPMDKELFNAWKELQRKPHGAQNSQEDVPGNEMRDLRISEQAGQAPSGREPVQQQPRERGDTVPDLSWETARERKMGEQAQREEVPLVRGDVHLQAPEGNNLLSVMREQIGMGASWWDTEMSLPRLATGVPARVQRLRCIGNGQVPSCAAMAWEILTASDGGEGEKP